MVRRLIRSWERSATGWSGRGGGAGGRGGSSSVVVRLVPGQGDPQVSLAEDQHPVGQLGPGGKHEAFRVGVRGGLRGGIFTVPMPALARTAPKDSVNCPARSRTRNRKSAARSPRSIRRLRICCVVHDPSGFRGDPEDVHTSAADLHDEQAIQAPERDRAVHVKVGGEHRRGLRVQELPPRRVSVPFRCRQYLRPFRTRRSVEAPARWPGLSSSPWIRWYPQPWSSVARRSISAVISALTGGRPIRFG
jgi:hypothetical protein